MSVDYQIRRTKTRRGDYAISVILDSKYKELIPLLNDRILNFFDDVNDSLEKDQEKKKRMIPPQREDSDYSSTEYIDNNNNNNNNNVPEKYSTGVYYTCSVLHPWGV